MSKNKPSSNSIYNLLVSSGLGVGKQSHGEFAAEVEAEFKEPINKVFPGWVIHNEGSLRGVAHEFVNNKPLLKQELFDALDKLFQEIEKPYKESHRTSTHIHQNIQSWGFEELIIHLLVYYICEPVFWKFAGKERKGNLFCLDPLTASGIMEYLVCLFKYDFVKIHKHFNQIKYSSLNIGCITKFGSLEYRHLRGTSDVDTIKRWVNLIEKVTKYAKQFQKVEDVWNLILESPNKFVYAATGVLVSQLEAEQNYSFCFQFYNEYMNSKKTYSRIKYKFEKDEVD